MEIAIVLFDGVTALDAVGPYEVLSRIPGAQLHFVAEEPGAVRTDNGMLSLLAERSLEQSQRPDVVLVPGGPGEARARESEQLLAWLRTVHESARWTTSVCTGSLVLAAAGLLEGRRATTHWLAMERLRELGAEPVSERVVFDGDIVTAAGVSAGIDMAIALTAEIAGETVAQAIQLGIEYDPQPPFHAGSPRTAPAEVVALLRERSRHQLDAPEHAPASG